MIALYFATNEHNDKDGCIWVINPRLLNSTIGHDNYIYPMDSNDVRSYLKSVFHRKGDPIDRDVIACWAEESDLRILLQQSAFTIHNSDTPLEILVDNLKISGIMEKIIIPSTKKKYLLQQVEICGFSLIDLFPDIEHLAQQLKNDISYI